MIKAKTNEKLIMNYAKKGLRYFIPSFFIVTINIFIGALIPLIIKVLIDFVIYPDPTANTGFIFDNLGFLFEYDRFSLLLSLLGSLIALVILKGIIEYISKWLTYRGGLKVFGYARHDALTKLSNLTKIDSEGDAFLALTDDIFNLSDFITEGIYHFYIYIVTAIITTVFIYMLNIYLGLIVTVFYPLFILISVLYNKANKKQLETVVREEAESASLTDDIVSGIKEIKSLGYEHYAIDTFDKQNNEEYSARFNKNKITNKYSLFLNLLRAVSYSTIIISAGFFAFFNLITVGAFVAIVSYSLTVFENLIFSINYLFDAKKYAAGVSRFKTMLEKKTKVTSKKSKEFINGNPEISFKKVSFKTGKSIVLNNISFDIKYGEHVGIIGTQGEGKTVVAKLMLRMLEPSTGGVFINDVDLKEININSIRGQFSYVPQEPFIFNDTIRGNIVLFEGEHSEDRLKEVVKTVGLNEYIKSQKSKLNEMLFEGGTGVASQERERLSIARAIYRNAPILLMDAPLNRFDALNGKELLSYVMKFYKKRTLIILSSRPEDVLTCDRVIYLKNGKIVENGSPKELLEKQGNFYKAYQKSKEWSGL